MLGGVTPRKPDIWKPPPDKTFTKGAVNRAGRLIARFFHEPREGGRGVWDGFDKDQVFEAMEAVTWWKQLHAVPLSRVAANLRYHVGEEDGELDGRIDVAQRLKKRDTIINKLDRYPKMELTQMHDIGGVRATLPDLACLNAVSRRLKKTWTVAKTRDYIAEPKESGYRAIHHEVRRNGRVIEVQLRTFRQHAWANQVEDDGRALGTGYKFGFGSESIHDYYRAISDVFFRTDSGQPIEDELRQRLQESYDKIKDVLRPSTARRSK
jgi:ppGpp synthetase/RelA/SpoT-type nucleotidyltranferase